MQYDQLVWFPIELLLEYSCSTFRPIVITVKET